MNYLGGGRGNWPQQKDKKNHEKSFRILLNEIPEYIKHAGFKTYLYAVLER